MAALLLGTELVAQRPEQRAPQSVDTMVVTAARREERLGHTVVATEVISAREIARAPVSDVGALLARFAGVQLDAGVPAGHGVALQGLGGPRVLILVDGQPLTGRVNGTLDLARIPLAMIERVEIVKGPQSTLYGSAAMGGVINIVTKRPSGSANASVSALGGSQARRELTGHGELARGAWSLRVDGGALGLGLAPGVEAEGGANTMRGFVAPRAVRRGRAGEWSVDASALVVDEAQRYRVGQLYSFSDNVQIGGQIAASKRRALSSFAPVLSWSRYDHLSRRASTPTPASDSGAHDVQSLVQMELPVSHVTERGIVDAGLVLRRESIRADRVPGGLRDVHSAEPYGQLTFSVGPAVVTSGARVTLHEQWGTFVAPRLAALWRANDAVSLRVGVGRGFRTPDFKEMFISFANTAAGYSVTGNPDLRPEHSTNVSATLSLTGRAATLRLNAHGTSYRDFIETDLAVGTSANYTYRNLAKGRIAGSEVEISRSAGIARFEASHAYLWSRDDASGRPLLGRAPQTASAGVVLSIVGAELSARGQWQSRTAVGGEEQGGALEYREAFGQLDVGASRRILARVSVRVGATNVFNALPRGTWPTFAGRQWFLGVSTR